jgi:hypothetical protein
MIRSITGAEELDLFCALNYIVNDELADDLASGRRRPAWMWVALRGGHLVTRAAWWGSDDDAAPSLLDIPDVADDPDRIDVGVRLLKRALSELIPPGARPPAYSRAAHPAGNGYINEILAEGTRILAAQDVPLIRASTDLGNVPMAEAFTRAGWVNFERSISMTWP